MPWVFISFQLTQFDRDAARGEVSTFITQLLGALAEYREYDAHWEVKVTVEREQVAAASTPDEEEEVRGAGPACLGGGVNMLGVWQGAGTHSMMHTGRLRLLWRENKN